MTTTKEKQMRAEFEAWFAGQHWGNEDFKTCLQMAFDAYPESYEKKLAMLEAEVLRLDAGWQEANQRALKHGLELDELKELHAIELAELNHIIQENSQSYVEQHIELLASWQQLSEANARNAMLVEVMTHLEWSNVHFDEFGDSQQYCPSCGGQKDASQYSADSGHKVGCQLERVISTNSEAVAAWEAEKQRTGCVCKDASGNALNQCNECPR